MADFQNSMPDSVQPDFRRKARPHPKWVHLKTRPFQAQKLIFGQLKFSGIELLIAPVHHKSTHFVKFDDATRPLNFTLVAASSYLYVMTSQITNVASQMQMSISFEWIIRMPKTIRFLIENEEKLFFSKYCRIFFGDSR